MKYVLNLSQSSLVYSHFEYKYIIKLSNSCRAKSDRKVDNFQSKFVKGESKVNLL